MFDGGNSPCCSSSTGLESIAIMKPKPCLKWPELEADRIHVNELVNGDKTLADYHIMAVPGGFSFGDHLGSGRLLGNRLRFGIREMVQDFVKAGKLVIGICNGFQVLVKMGLLPGDEDVSLTQTASLTLNNTGHYEDRWVHLEFDPNSPCVWTKGLERIRVPVRHGEGNS